MKVNLCEMGEGGRIIDDLIINFFESYQVVSDAKFVSYIKVNKYQYDGDENMSLHQLMTISLNKYNILTKSDKWNYILL